LEAGFVWEDLFKNPEYRCEESSPEVLRMGPALHPALKDKR
jgi:hypothetical protein